MPYAIPANIRYEERLLGPLTIKQSIYFGAFAMAAGFVWFNEKLNPAIKLPLALFLAGIGFAFAFLNLEEHLKNQIGYMQSTKQSSWISTAARKLMNVRSIRADAVFMQEHRILGVIRVTPINFGVLGEQDKDTVIYGFLEFLNSLNFPIQIVMRSINLDLDDYMNNLRRRIKQRDDKLALAYYEHFAEYMRNYIKVNKINDRHFYIIVSEKKKASEKETLNNLEIRCQEITSRLAISGIVSEKLNTHKLINFYKSYFTDSFEIFDSQVSPITMYRKMWRDAPRPVAQAKETGQENTEAK
jgi:hypothetical protein